MFQLFLFLLIQLSTSSIYVIDNYALIKTSESDIFREELYRPESGWIEGLVHDRTRNELYFRDLGVGAIMRFDIETREVSVVAYKGSDESLPGGEFVGSQSGRVSGFDSVNRRYIWLGNYYYQLNYLDVDSGQYYNIVTFDYTWTYLSQIAVDSSGRIYMTRGNNELLRYDSLEGWISLDVSSSYMRTGIDILIDETEKVFYVADNYLYEMDVATLEKNTKNLIAITNSVYSLSMDLSNNRFIFESDGTVVIHTFSTIIEQSYITDIGGDYPGIAYSPEEDITLESLSFTCDNTVDYTNEEKGFILFAGPLDIKKLYLNSFRDEYIFYTSGNAYRGPVIDYQRGYVYVIDFEDRGLYNVSLNGQSLDLVFLDYDQEWFTDSDRQNFALDSQNNLLYFLYSGQLCSFDLDGMSGRTLPKVVYNLGTSLTYGELDVDCNGNVYMSSSRGVLMYSVEHQRIFPINPLSESGSAKGLEVVNKDGNVEVYWSVYNRIYSRSLPSGDEVLVYYEEDEYVEFYSINIEPVTSTLVIGSNLNGDLYTNAIVFVDLTSENEYPLFTRPFSNPQYQIAVFPGIDGPFASASGNDCSLLGVSILFTIVMNLF